MLVTLDCHVIAELLFASFWNASFSRGIVRIFASSVVVHVVVFQPIKDQRWLDVDRSLECRQIALGRPKSDKVAGQHSDRLTDQASRL